MGGITSKIPSWSPHGTQKKRLELRGSHMSVVRVMVLCCQSILPRCRVFWNDLNVSQPARVPPPSSSQTLRPRPRLIVRHLPQHDLIFLRAPTDSETSQSRHQRSVPYRNIKGSKQNGKTVNRRSKPWKDRKKAQIEFMNVVVRFFR
jgi:hypothetical protein